MISFEEACEALQSFEILEIERKPDNTCVTTCSLVSEVLSSSSSPLKDLVFALKVSSLLKGDAKDSHFKVSSSNSLFWFSGPYRLYGVVFVDSFPSSPVLSRQQR